MGITVYPDTPDTETIIAGQEKVWVFDDIAQELLESILRQLKLANIHNQLITEEELCEGDF